VVCDLEVFVGNREVKRQVAEVGKKKMKDRDVVVGNREVVKRQVAEVGNKGEAVVIKLERAKRRVFVHPIDHLCKQIKAE
jgi:hypothetical protein